MSTFQTDAFQQLVRMQTLPNCIEPIPDLLDKLEESQAVSRLGKKPQMTEKIRLGECLTHGCWYFPLCAAVGRTGGGYWEVIESM